MYIKVVLKSLMKDFLNSETQLMTQAKASKRVLIRRQIESYLYCKMLSVSLNSHNFTVIPFAIPYKKINKTAEIEALTLSAIISII